jgi:hypothetical protein
MRRAPIAAEDPHDASRVDRIGQLGDPSLRRLGILQDIFTNIVRPG